MIWIYKYDASIYCDWQIETIMFVYGKIPYFSRYVVEFPTKTYELYIIIMIPQAYAFMKCMTKDIIKISYNLG